MEKIFTATGCLSRAEIQHYLDDALSKERRFKVENHLLDCPLCAAAVEGFESSSTAESEGALDDLYAAIDQRTSFPATEAPTRTIRPWNRIAAAIAFLIVAGAAWLYFNQTNTDQNYLAYFEDATVSSAVRGEGSDLLTEDLIAGVRLYEKENYQGSLSFFEDYLETQESGVAHFYAGLSALKTGALGLAEEYLKTARLNEESLYESTTWYLVKIYLDRGESDKAKQLLQELTVVENGFYSEQAQKLLEEI